MPNLRIGFTVEGTRTLQRNLQLLGLEAVPAMGAGLLEEAEVIMTEAKVLVPVDQGELRASGHVQGPEISGPNVSVAVGFGGAAAPYAVWVHEGIGPAVGRPPFFPPLEKIKAWVKRHGMDESAAYPVARAIGQRGIPATKFLETPAKARTAGMAGRLARFLKARYDRIVG